MDTQLTKKEKIEKIKQMSYFRNKARNPLVDYVPNPINKSTAEFELSVLSFTLNGHGFSGDSCQRPYVHGYTIDLETRDVHKLNFGLMRCDRIQCHYCSPFLLQEKIYETAYKLFSYKLETNKRLYSASVSLPPSVYEQICTSKDLHDAKRNLMNFTKSIGIDGGLVLLHPFSIKTKIRQRMQKDGLSWSDMWDVVQYNTYEYNSWLEYVDLHIHYHVIGFSDKSIGTIIKGNKICKVFGELETLDDLLNSLKYIFSHIATFNEADRENKPIEIKSYNYFGSLYKYSAPENIELKNIIATSLNGYYNEEKDKFNVHPIPDDETKQYFALNSSKKHKHELFNQLYQRHSYKLAKHPKYDLSKQYQSIEKYNQESQNEQILNNIIECENKLPAYEQLYLVPIDYIPDVPRPCFTHSLHADIVQCIEIVQLFNYFSIDDLKQSLHVKTPICDSHKIREQELKLEKFNYVGKCILLYESIVSDTSLPSHERHLFISRIPSPPTHLSCAGLDLQHIRCDYNPAYNISSATLVESFGTEHSKYHLRYKEVLETSNSYTSLLNDAQSYSSRIQKFTTPENACEKERKRNANMSLRYDDFDEYLYDDIDEYYHPDFEQQKMFDALSDDIDEYYHPDFEQQKMFDVLSDNYEYQCINPVCA
jgi:hypothetical protein